MRIAIPVKPVDRVEHVERVKQVLVLWCLLTWFEKQFTQPLTTRLCSFNVCEYYFPFVALSSSVGWFKFGCTWPGTKHLSNTFSSKSRTPHPAYYIPKLCLYHRVFLLVHRWWTLARIWHHALSQWVKNTATMHVPSTTHLLPSTTLLCTQLTNTKHSWQNATRCRDGVKLLWCHSHLVFVGLRVPSLHALVFIQKTFVWLYIYNR